MCLRSVFASQMYTETVQPYLSQIKGYASTEFRQRQCFLQVECDHESVITRLGKQPILLLCFKRLFSKLPVSSMCRFIACITNCTCVRLRCSKTHIEVITEDKTIGRQWSRLYAPLSRELSLYKRYIIEIFSQGDKNCLFGLLLWE